MTSLASSATSEFYRELFPHGKSMTQVLEYRQELIAWAMRSESARADLWSMCARDILFFINTFGFTFDPRRTPTVIPFVTWDYQNEAIALLQEAILEGFDVVIDKSRDMGATWLCELVPAHMWHFHDDLTFLFVSRKEDLVDRKGDPDSMMSKLDFFHERLPKWLMPPITRKHMHFGNPITRSTIDGESTTGDLGRGGRRTAILLDEFAAVDEGYQVLSSTRDVTRCRIFNSTPKGTHTAHYKMVRSDCRKIRMHWSQHPLKNQGLYTSTPEAQLQLLDPNPDYQFPEGFTPKLDGKVRSPWYDNECARCVHQWEVEQELDINHMGASFQFFDGDTLDQLKALYGLPAFYTGDLDFTVDTLTPQGFVSAPGGPLRLWTTPGAAGEIQGHDPYVIGIDVATGTGASNSVLSVVNSLTHEKVAEFATPHMRPDELAHAAVALAKWFNDAFMIWEANGPGRNFGSTVVETGYRNFYYRTQDTSITKRASDFPGWWSTKESRKDLLSQYRRALYDRQFVNRSIEAIEECHAYVYTDTQDIIHSGALDKADPTGARDNHSDRTIADALASKMCKQLSASAVSKPKTEVQIPIGSFAYRRQLRERAAREKALVY